MKEFDLNLAKHGHPVCTRNGHDARIICFDCKSNNYPIIALISYSDHEEVSNYSSKGHFTIDNIPDELDLMMVTSKKEGWINIYKNNQISKRIFNTKEEALVCKTPSDYLATVKIEWEE